MAEALTTTRQRLSGAATGSEAVEPIRSAEELRSAVARRRRPRRPVELTVESVDLVRLLTLLPPSVEAQRLVLTVTDWERPTTTWQGRTGHLQGLVSCAARYPVDRTGAATVDVEVAELQPLADLARAVYPMLAPRRGQHGYGFIEVATVDLPDAGLALLPTPTAPGVPLPPSSHLEGVGLADAEVALVGSPETLAALTTPPNLEEARPPADVQHPLLVDPSGHLAVAERTGVPLVDLNVHNPVGRLYTFDEPQGAITLTLEGGELGFRFDDAADEGEKAVGWSRPLHLPLSAAEVRLLRSIEAIGLGELRPDSDAEETALYRRLAELAATGVVLHGLSPDLPRTVDVLGPALATLLRSPYRPTIGLVRELRSVPQRREAMLRFGGFFELASQTERLGHRLLPTVSVVLSSMRPGRVPAVLRALTAQTYPHVEVAVGLHGVDAPADPDFEEAVRLADAIVVPHDARTPFGTVLAETARRTTGDLVVKIDDDDVYGPHVIEDLVLAYLYSNADVVGKTTEYLYFENFHHTVHRTFVTERYHTQVAGGAMLLSRAALTAVGGWRPSTNSTDRSVLIRVGNDGGIAYRTHSLGYVYVRHNDGHTWKQGDSLLLRNGVEQWTRFMPEIIES